MKQGLFRRLGSLKTEGLTHEQGSLRQGLSHSNLIAAATITLSLMGCVKAVRQGVADQGSGTDSSQSVSLNVYSDAPYSASKVVCEPFSEPDPDAGSTGFFGFNDIEDGIRGRLYYIPPGQPTYTNVDKYLIHGVDAGLYIFLNQIHVPTRRFDRGFEAMDGNILRINPTEILMEWFALDMETSIGLTPTDPAGLYQLGVLSDDGAILSIKDYLADNPYSTPWEDLINNDGLTPTRMACATKALPLAALDRVPMRLKYFQGPRTHIALTVLWRKVSGNAAADLHDPLCGAYGNDLFFDSNVVPSQPMRAFRDLEARGWKVLQPSHYSLPAHIRPSPCSG